MPLLYISNGMLPRPTKRTVERRIRQRKTVVEAFVRELKMRERLLGLLKTCDTEIIEIAISSIGSARGAASWLTRTQRGLNGKIPLKMAVNSKTKAEIVTLLVRIKYCILS